MKTPFTYNLADSEENHRVDSRDWRASVSSLPPIKVRESAFTYNHPLTFHKHLIRAQRILFWQSFAIWIVLSLAIFGLLKLFWGWL